MEKTIYKALHRKLKIEQHKPHNHRRTDNIMTKGKRKNDQ